jgi:hypothetical protein
MPSRAISVLDEAKPTSLGSTQEATRQVRARNADVQAVHCAQTCVPRA